MKTICTYVGSFILSVLFVLFPMLLGYGITAHWKSLVIFLLVVMVVCEFFCVWMWFIAEVSD